MPKFLMDYEEYYGDFTDRKAVWREKMDQLRANNITTICAGHTFNTAIDIGAGTGDILAYLSKTSFAKKYYALEVSKNAVQIIKKKGIESLADIQQYDGKTIPYPDKYFDVAYLSHVLEHIENLDLLINEIKRVSMYTIFELPLEKTLLFYIRKILNGNSNLKKIGHINYWTKKGFLRFLEANGFKIIKHGAVYIPKYLRLLSIDSGFKGYVHILKLSLRNTVKNLLPRFYLNLFSDSYIAFVKNI